MTPSSHRRLVCQRAGCPAIRLGPKYPVAIPQSKPETSMTETSEIFTHKGRPSLLTLPQSVHDAANASQALPHNNTMNLTKPPPNSTDLAQPESPCWSAAD